MPMAQTCGGPGSVHWGLGHAPALGLPVPWALETKATAQREGAQGTAEDALATPKGLGRWEQAGSWEAAPQAGTLGKLVPLSCIPSPELSLSNDSAIAKRA